MQFRALKRIVYVLACFFISLIVGRKFDQRNGYLKRYGLFKEV